MRDIGESSDAAAFMLAPVEGDEMVGMVSDNGEVQRRAPSPAAGSTRRRGVAARGARRRLTRHARRAGQVSFKAIVATGLVKGATSMQKTAPVCSAALGRTLICALMLAQGKKDGVMYGEEGRETLQIDIRGDGPIKQVFAIADGQGEVRGYTAQPQVSLPPNDKGKLDVAAAVGKGFITVVRNNVLWKQPYTGITQIVSGEIAEDIAHYLTGERAYHAPPPRPCARAPPRPTSSTPHAPRPPPPPPRPPRTKWTRRVPHPVLSGHAASLTPY